MITLLTLSPTRTRDLKKKSDSLWLSLWIDGLIVLVLVN
jgi:hypothetical protein